MKKHLIFTTTAVLAALLLSGCGAAVKRCEAPELNLPERITPYETVDSLCIADLEWWDVYADTLLQSLIRKTLDNNRDMLSAAARVREFEKLHRVKKAGQLPSLSARFYPQYEQYDYTFDDKVIDPEIGLKATLSWEVDFFGRLRWASREALAEYLSSVEAQRALQMTLIADVATAYYELIALDNELEIVMRTLETRSENERHAKLRFEGGLTSETTYQQSKVEYATTAALVPDLQKQIKMKENEISMLAGSYPTSVQRSLMDETDTLIRDVLHVGIPSELLKRRPDVRVSEQSLQAAMARVGVKWADRFPRFSISLTGGIENNTFQRFFSAPFLLGLPDIVAPLFSFGKRKADYEAAIAAYDNARFQYEKKVMQVFEEVNNAVVSYNSAREKVLLMQNLKDAARRYVDLARFQYINGSINYIDVLDAQRSYFDAEIDLSNAVRDELLAMVNLYKSLGGGWKDSVQADTGKDKKTEKKK